jgi:hypothetical protein
VVRLDGLYFQDLFQSHSNWNWRGKSPFVSVAATLEPALLFCEIYLSKGCQGVKIHVINMCSKDWNRKKQRIFHADNIAQRLGLRRRPSYRHEYLVESEIPRGCIIESLDPWDLPDHCEIYMERISDMLARRKRAWNIRRRFSQARKKAAKLRALAARNRAARKRREEQSSAEKERKQHRNAEEVPELVMHGQRGGDHQEGRDGEGELAEDTVMGEKGEEQQRDAEDEAREEGEDAVMRGETEHDDHNRGDHGNVE